MNSPGKYSFEQSPERIYSTGDFADILGTRKAITVFRWVQSGKVKADFVWMMKNNRGVSTERYYFLESTLKKMLIEMGWNGK